MPTQAYSAYGTSVRLGDGTPLAPLTITNATNATPIVVTTSTAHGIADFSYVTITGVGGNTAANGTWIVQTLSTTTLALRLSVGNGAYTSGGSLVRESTFASIAELRNVQDAGSRATLVDCSAHDGNGYSSEVPIIKATNALRLSLNLVPDNATHDETTGLLGLYASGARRHWLLVLPAYPGSGVKSVGHMYGFVDYYTLGLPTNDVVQAECTLAFDGALTWSRQ